MSRSHLSGEADPDGRGYRTPKGSGEADASGPIGAEHQPTLDDFGMPRGHRPTNPQTERVFVADSAGSTRVESSSANARGEDIGGKQMPSGHRLLLAPAGQFFEPGSEIRPADLKGNHHVFIMTDVRHEHDKNLGPLTLYASSIHGPPKALCNEVERFSDTRRWVATGFDSAEDAERALAARLVEVDPKYFRKFGADSKVKVRQVRDKETISGYEGNTYTRERPPSRYWVNSKEAAFLLGHSAPPKYVVALRTGRKGALELENARAGTAAELELSRPLGPKDGLWVAEFESLEAAKAAAATIREDYQTQQERLNKQYASINRERLKSARLPLYAPSVDAAIVEHQGTEYFGSANRLIPHMPTHPYSVWIKFVGKFQLVDCGSTANTESLRNINLAGGLVRESLWVGHFRDFKSASSALFKIRQIDAQRKAGTYSGDYRHPLPARRREIDYGPSSQELRSEMYRREAAERNRGRNDGDVGAGLGGHFKADVQDRVDKGSGKYNEGKHISGEGSSGKRASGKGD